MSRLSRRSFTARRRKEMRRRTRHGYPPFAVLAVRARSLRPGLATSGIGQDWELGRNFGGKITDPLQPVFAQDLSGAVDGRAAPGWPGPDAGLRGGEHGAGRGRYELRQLPAGHRRDRILGEIVVWALRIQGRTWCLPRAATPTTPRPLASDVPNDALETKGPITPVVTEWI